MLDRLNQSAKAGLSAVAATVFVFLVAGCQQFPKSTWPVTSRGAQPTQETAPTPDIALVQKAALPATVPASPKIIPVARQSDGSETDSWFRDDSSDEASNSHAASVFRPGFAGGLLSPIDRSSDVVAIDGSTDDPANAGGFFGSDVDGDDPTFGYNVGQSMEQFEPRISFKDDIFGLPLMFWNDAKSIVTWPNVVVLGAAAGAAVIIRDDLDQRVRYETAEHPLRWGQGSVVLRQFGEYSYQVPVLAGVYALSLWTENDHLHEFSVAAFSAYGLTAISTVAIKGMTNTTRPTTQFENGHYGFPSYHAASTFSLAACIEEYYGWQLGLPAYALAGLVGWSRIDQREHDLSDVFFGSVLGFVIGKSVAAAHLDRRANMQMTPYYDAQNRAAAVSLEKRF
jgi:membrane-associated phospholipid phosphatase